MMPLAGYRITILSFNKFKGKKGSSWAVNLFNVIKVNENISFDYIETKNVVGLLY